MYKKKVAEIRERARDWYVAIFLEDVDDNVDVDVDFDDRDGDDGLSWLALPFLRRRFLLGGERGLSKVVIMILYVVVLCTTFLTLPFLWSRYPDSNFQSCSFSNPIQSNATVAMIDGFLKQKCYVSVCLKRCSLMKVNYRYD